MTTQELIAFVKKNPIGVGCGVLSLALAAGIYLRFDAVPEANNALDERSTLARRYALNISYGAQLREQLETITAANKAIASRLILPTDIGINQQFFYKLESETGVKLLDLRQGGRSATKGDLAYIGFSVSVQGEFPQVMAFLRALEDGSHYCRVLTASCSGGRAGPVSLSLNLELLGRP